MLSRRDRLAAAALAAATLLAPALAGAAPISYRLRFERYWNESQVEPGTYPGNAHFTQLAIATHDETPLWLPGQAASPGLEDLAETGSTTRIEAEVRARVSAGTAGGYFEAPAPFIGTLETETTFTVDLAHRFVSAASMVAPSPDWFVGIYGVDLAPAGEFVAQLGFELRPWDAGTEQGGLFRLENPDSDPRGAIAPRRRPFVGDPVIGRITLTQIPEPGSLLLAAAGLLGLAWRARAAGR